MILYYYSIISNQILLKKEKALFQKNLKLKKNNSLFNIWGTVIDSDIKGKNNILIEKDYKEYGLKLNDVCIVNHNLIKKIEYNVRLKILKH